jgi:hypothetical protein
MTRVSLAELASAGFVLHSAEAAAIVVEVCRQYTSGLVPGIPSAHVIRLTPEGSVVAEGPITTDHPPLAKAAHLLNELLPPFGAPPTYRVPGGLRLVVARALGTLDLPPFESLDAFSSALARFAAEDLTTTAQTLYRAWKYAQVPEVLTISDLRRARRATGLSLENISTACGVSTTLLRELEWGYLKNWRNDEGGRARLAVYARASGLNEQLVMSIVVPMLEEADPRETGGADTTFVASGPQALVPCKVVKAVRPTRVRAILRASASAAAIALVAYGATMGRAKAPNEARVGSPRDFVPDIVSADAPFVSPDAPSVSADAPSVRTDAPSVRMATPLPVHLMYASHTRPAAPARVSKAHSPTKHASSASNAPPVTRKPARPNFFKRVLLRIVIK